MELKAAVTDYIDAYEFHVRWEPLSDIRERAADLLAAMLLARVDGKSPVDYLTEADRTLVRNFAHDRLLGKGISPAAIADDWHSEFG